MKHPSIVQTEVLIPAVSKSMIDAYLTPLLNLRVHEAKGIGADYELLWKELKRLYKAGGKRLRSYMTLLTFQMYSDRDLKAILPAAAAQELMHLAMLIHDDIIDRDLIRYGTENVTGRYLKHYKSDLSSRVERRHYAESAAILAGDLLLSEAYILLAQSDVEPKAILAAQQMVAQSIFHVVGGELLDTEASFKASHGVDPLLIAEQKTASYSFVGPFLLGATLANAPKDQIYALQKLGELLGIAYQLRDDIMGVFGDEALTGKSTVGDLREGKRTVLIDEFYKRAPKEAIKQFDGVFGHHHASQASLKKIKKLIETSGAKQAVEARIEAGRLEALELIESLKVDEPHKKAFVQLVSMALRRQA